MRFLLAGAFLAMFAGSSLADDDAWVYFCTDDYCSENCGQWVNAGNPGCLNEPDRRSMFIKGNHYPYIVAVVSPGEDCHCQSDCIGDYEIGWGGECVWNPAIDGESLRFITGPCGDNNC